MGKRLQDKESLGCVSNGLASTGINNGKSAIAPNMSANISRKTLGAPNSVHYASEAPPYGSAFGDANKMTQVKAVTLPSQAPEWAQGTCEGHHCHNCTGKYFFPLVNSNGPLHRPSVTHDPSTGWRTGPPFEKPLSPSQDDVALIYDSYAHEQPYRRMQGTMHPQNNGQDKMADRHSISNQNIPASQEKDRSRVIPVVETSNVLALKFPVVNKVITLGNKSQVNDFFIKTCDTLQGNVLKPTLKAWIKFIEPGKQKNWSYTGERGPPPWWPPDVRHREPDHLKKDENIKLAVKILWYVIEDPEINLRLDNEAVQALRDETERQNSGRKPKAKSLVNDADITNSSERERQEQRNSEIQLRHLRKLHHLKQVLYVALERQRVHRDEKDESETIEVRLFEDVPSGSRKRSRTSQSPSGSPAPEEGITIKIEASSRNNAQPKSTGKRRRAESSVETPRSRKAMRPLGDIESEASSPMAEPDQSEHYVNSSPPTMGHPVAPMYSNMETVATQSVLAQPQPFMLYPVQDLHQYHCPPGSVPSTPNTLIGPPLSSTAMQCLEPEAQFLVHHGVDPSVAEVMTTNELAQMSFHSDSSAPCEQDFLTASHMVMHGRGVTFGAASNDPFHEHLTEDPTAMSISYGTEADPDTVPVSPVDVKPIPTATSFSAWDIHSAYA